MMEASGGGDGVCIKLVLAEESDSWCDSSVDVVSFKLMIMVVILIVFTCFVLV